MLFSYILRTSAGKIWRRAADLEDKTLRRKKRGGPGEISVQEAGKFGKGELVLVRRCCYACMSHFAINVLAML